MTGENKRVHGIEAAGAGHAGTVTRSTRLGPCPSCRAEVRVTKMQHPHTGRLERAMIAP